MRNFLTLILFAVCFAFAAETLFDGNSLEVWPKQVKQKEENVLAVAASPRHTVSAKVFAVDPQKSTKISGEFRFVGTVKSGMAKLYFGFEPRTEKNRSIRPNHIHVLSKTLTETVEDTAKGSTTIIIKDSSAWKFNKHSYLAFNAAADNSDLPNFNLSPLIASTEAQADGTTLVTFKTPLRADVPAGTVVRLQADGSTFIYAAASGNKLTEEWQTFTGTIKEVRSGAYAKNWWTGTSKAAVVFFMLGGNFSGDLEFRNIKVETID